VQCRITANYVWRRTADFLFSMMPEAAKHNYALCEAFFWRAACGLQRIVVNLLNLQAAWQKKASLHPAE